MSYSTKFFCVNFIIYKLKVNPSSTNYESNVKIIFSMYNS